MAALLSVYHLPIVLSIHGERPSMTGLACHIIYITLPYPMAFCRAVLVAHDTCEVLSLKKEM